MSHSSSAAVATANADKLMRQLCKHWAHNLAVTLDDTGGRITFPAKGRAGDWPGEAVISLRPEGAVLHCRIEASAAGQLDGLKGALASHLDRFAFREAPLAFAWHDG